MEYAGMMFIFASVNIFFLKQVSMNKVKVILATALIFAMSVPCFASGIVIKRKKKKWNHSVEQKMSDLIESNQQITALLF